MNNLNQSLTEYQKREGKTTDPDPTILGVTWAY